MSDKQRYGRTGASSWGLVDNLTLTRTGNQLTSVSDSGLAAYSGDFNAAAGTSTYNANGALATDSGRGISSITWDEIDLPQTVTFSNGSTINYYYAADGTKLREVRAVAAGGSTTTTTIDWCGDLVLEKVGSGTRAAKRLRLDGGYVDLASGNSARRYFVRDHLGSVRAVVNDAGTVLETDDYYPLGGPLPTGSNTALQPEKYQGKDWNPAASFNVYDFGARLYDPALGRWLSQDPMAEKYYLHSPYLFCAGNPLRFVDPSGLSSYIVNGETYTIDDGDDNFSMSVSMDEYERLQRKFEKSKFAYARLREKLSSRNEYTIASVKPSTQGENVLDAAVLTLQQTPGTSYIQNQAMSLPIGDLFSILASVTDKDVASRVNIGSNNISYFRKMNGRIFNGNQFVTVLNLYNVVKGVSLAANTIDLFSVYADAQRVSSQLDPVSADLYSRSIFWGSSAGLLLQPLTTKGGVAAGGALAGPEGAVAGGIAGGILGGMIIPSAIEDIILGRW